MVIKVPKRITAIIEGARDYELVPVVYSGDVSVQETDDKYILTVNSDAWIVLYDRGKRAIAEYMIENSKVSKKVYGTYLEQYLP